MTEEKTTAKDVKEYSAEWWVQQIDEVEKALNDKWRTSARKVVDRYLDDRSTETSTLDSGDKRKYNIFWANVQILKSALYAVPPKPEVRRQHGDSKDDIARTAAMMLQRMLTFAMLEDNSKEHEALKKVVEDRLIPGLGQAWVRYEVDTKDIEVPPEIPGGAPTVGKVIVDERAPIDYVHWDDFYWSPSRTWEEVWWVGRRVWMTKKTFVRRFTQAKLDKLKSDMAQQNYDEKGYPKGFQKGRIEIFEAWCEDTNKVYWFHRSTKTMMDERDDPLRLKNFWPCPKPLLSTHSTGSLIPRPDFVMMQDQYDELDELNNRISILTKALRVVGAYDAENTDLANMLSGGELRMIPVANWAMFSEKKGLAGAVDWFPIEQVAKVLSGLIEQRPMVIQQIYELSGISDIMRGVSAPRETAKAQTLKAQYSSVRLQLTQEDVALFVSSVFRLKVEVIATHFQPTSIIKQSQIEQTESAQFAEPAVQLIKDTGMRDYRIIVNGQGLSLADYNDERELRIQFLTTVGQFFSQVSEMAVTTPGALPYMLRMVAWVAASMRGSDDIESVIDEGIQALTQNPVEPPKEDQEPPDRSMEIEQLKDKRERDLAEQKLAFEKGKLEREDMKLAREDEMNKQHELRLVALEQSFTQAKEETGQQQEGLIKGFEVIAQAMESMVTSQTELITKVVEGQHEISEALSGLSEAMCKKKRRTPQRDANGDITHVDEETIN